MQAHNSGKKAFKVVVYFADGTDRAVAHPFSFDKASNALFSFMMVSTMTKRDWIAVATFSPNYDVAEFWTKPDFENHCSRIVRSRKLREVGAPQAIIDINDDLVKSHKKHRDTEWAKVAYNYWLYYWCTIRKKED